jgi:electron transfer flavoprotein alpha/beta subunit
VGGSIGLAVLGTVAWTVIAHTAHGATAGTAAYQHALATGFDRAFLVAAGIALFTLVIAVALIRVRRDELSGAHG